MKVVQSKNEKKFKKLKEDLLSRKILFMIKSYESNITVYTQVLLHTTHENLLILQLEIVDVQAIA